MSRKILALLEIDADGTIHVTGGPEIDPAPRANALPAAPSWATRPYRREVTIELAQVRTRVVTRGLVDGRAAKVEGIDGGAVVWVERGDVALAALAALRWLAGEGERP